MTTKINRSKIIFMISIITAYLTFGTIFYGLVTFGIIDKLPLPVDAYELSVAKKNQTNFAENLEAAQDFFIDKMIKDNGHVDLYYAIDKSKTIDGQYDTNSEAISYLMLWTAKAGMKEEFDRAVMFVENHMLQPDFRYMMWRLDQSDIARGDGINMATDADLRAIHALKIASERWPEKRYDILSKQLADALLKIGLTDDGLLAPYGGASGKESIWNTQEVWLSYTYFPAFAELSERYGEPWDEVYLNMKKAVLDAQIANGLYNQQLTLKRDHGTGPDGGGYSINSLWIMVRSAESNDTELMDSARKGLSFYISRYEKDLVLYTKYNSNGDPISSSDSPWVYALVGRAAIALDDAEFSRKMIEELVRFQVTDKDSDIYGAIPELDPSIPRVGQFTMQESILTLQAYVTRYET